jgi:hypothetical protein
MRQAERWKRAPPLEACATLGENAGKRKILPQDAAGSTLEACATPGSVRHPKKEMPPNWGFQLRLAF